MTQSTDVDVIALYLPQFHPIPENDEWWGAGFTEWTNVAAARPLFPGHRQPLLPGALGFYDLRLPETRNAQAELARMYGVRAFCYWHYWFGDGERLLERPFREVLESGEPDFPFCLAWANQSWTGIWHGAPGRVLRQQRYGDSSDDLRHFELLAEAFADQRYFRIEGRPLFYVYRPQDLPNPRDFAGRLAGFCDSRGLPPPYLVGETSRLGWRPSQSGFDAAVCVSVVPDWVRRRRSPGRRYRHSFTRRSAEFIHRHGQPLVRSYRSLAPHMVWSYEEFGVEEESFPTVVPGWDNTPRSGRQGRVLVGSTPELFADQVRNARMILRHRERERRLIFVKSWNEWAEGNVLEPDRVNGTAYLEALSRVVHRAW